MLTLLTHSGQRDCEGHSRREFLRIGSLGLGGLTLPWLLQNQACAREGIDYVRDKSVIFLFLCGGPSQMETFDPNMGAPAPHHSVTGEVKTSIPGVTFGATFPKLAKRAHRLAVVRSYSPHKESNHAKAIKKVFTADDPVGTEASLGAIATRVRGNSFSAGGLPSFTTLIENEVDSQYREDMERMRSSNSPGSLGASCAPFDPIGKGALQEDLKLHLPAARLNDRLALLNQIDNLNRRMDADRRIETLDQYERQAMNVLTGNALKDAINLGKEDRRLVEKYDTTRYEVGFFKKRASTLGRRLLLARRLCEAGCGFVTVGSAGWDNHGNGNHPGVYDGMQFLSPPVDQAVSAFLDDVRERGLSDKILLIITGEFGRTPKLEKKGGRGHWPGLCPLIFAGGGLEMGQVIGKSRRTADLPDGEPILLANMVATIMHTLFDVGQLRLDPGVPQDLSRLITSGKPISQLTI